jgi:hypothetical protein
MSPLVNVNRPAAERRAVVVVEDYADVRSSPAKTRDARQTLASTSRMFPEP